MTEYSNEHILEDDYPIFPGYCYVADGKPIKANVGTETTAAEFKKEAGIKELRRCDMVGRELF